MQIVKKLSLFVAVLAIFALLDFLYQQRVKAPDVTFTTIYGKTIKMDDLREKVVLVNFWASDCYSCVREMPDLVKTYNQFKPKGLEVIAVAMYYDPPAQVLNYAKQKALPFAVMHDGFDEIEKKFHGVSATPTTFVFDKTGKRLMRKVGEIDFVKLNQLLENELS